MKKLTIFALMMICFTCLFSANLRAQTVYRTEELFTIPWGENPGELSLFWHTPDPYGFLGYETPGPLHFSETGGFIVHDIPSENMRRLSKFSINGEFVAQIDLWESDLKVPTDLYISDTGMILLKSGRDIYLLDQNLNLVSSIDLPTNVSNFFPSLNGGFWCIYVESYFDSDHVKKYYFGYNPDGSTTMPVMLFEGDRSEYATSGSAYIAPDGTILDSFVDKYGYGYTVDVEHDPEWPLVKLERLSPQDQIVYTHEMPFSGMWQDEFIVMNSGNYIKVYGQQDGLAITKYSLNHDPICLLEVATPMPYVGSLPAAITFDASGSYDPDGDEQNYHWDFNGDGVFDGVGDEYTGDPWNPTHEFNQYGIHDVMLKVTDNYGGECIAVIQVTIIEMN